MTVVYSTTKKQFLKNRSIPEYWSYKIETIVVVFEKLKMKSDRKSSNFSFYWTKNLNRNNFKHIILPPSFCIFSRPKDINSCLK